MERLITRHQNRKLYDSTAKAYVSLEGIADLVARGESVRIVEHPGGEDATTRILAQALVDVVKRKAQSIPASLMETLLRLASGGVAHQAAEASRPIRDLAERARREAEGIATRLVSRGRLGIEEALSLRKEVEDAIQGGMRAAENAAKRPLAALAPGHDAATIAGLARELKSLEDLVAKTANKSSAKAGRAHTRARPRSTPRSRS